MEIYMNMNCLTESVLESGGDIIPIIIDSKDTNGTGTFNPSIWIDENRKLLTVRHCQVTVWHSSKFQHSLAPITYINPENDISLRSSNIIVELSDNLEQKKHIFVDMLLDTVPKWEFIGLEDPRLVIWDNKLLLCGGRRDTTPNGVGRLEITEIHPETYVEIKRTRFEPPVNSYCEKNWMPINDLPWHFVKWSNPTEIIKVDYEKGTCTQILLKTQESKFQFTDFRGGSNVVKVGKYRICIVHITRIFKSEAGKKNSKYTHAVIVWDLDWNIVSISEEFSFMNTDIEFCCGLALDRDDFVISFGVQDNSSFLLKMKKETMENLICLKLES